MKKFLFIFIISFIGITPIALLIIYVQTPDNYNLIEVYISLISSLGVVGALYWSVRTNRENHQFEEPEIFIICKPQWSSNATNVELVQVTNVGKWPALRVKVYISRDSSFSDPEKFYCDHTDMLLPTMNTNNNVVISTHKFIAFDSKRPYKKPIDISRCIFYDAGDDFYKSYIRFEYSSMYNRNIRKKDFTIFFESPVETKIGDLTHKTYRTINNVEGIV